MRLIDAEAFVQSEIDRCGCVPLVGTYTMNNEYLSERLKSAPTIEAKPVVYAHWKRKNNETKCSNCEFIYYSNHDDFNYCPNCGAKMDGGERK